MKKYVGVMVAIILIVALAMPVFAESEIKTENVEAKVVEINGTEELSEDNKPTQKVEKVTVRVLEGEYKDEEYEMEYVITEDTENITSKMELKEEEKVLVSLEEKDGEVTNITYVEKVNSNYLLYIVCAILIILLLIISRKRATLIYIGAIILISFAIILSLKNAWNLILVSSIISVVLTTILFISINSINKETIIMIIRALLAIAISGILIYLIIDIMNLASINIKITDKFVNIKEIVCSVTILFSLGIYNAIAISGQYIFYANNKQYKTKSDNIIEGQRTLKL